MDLLKKSILFLLVIAFPLGEIARVAINETATTLIDIAVATSVLAWFLSKRRVPDTKLTKPMLLFVGTLFFSLIFNASRLALSELFISSLYLFRWIFYAAIYFAITDLRLIKNSIRNWMLLGGLLIVFAGFLQYFLYPDLRNLFYLGWDEHLYRMFTFTFFDPNFAGTFFVLYFLFLIDSLFRKPTLILKLISTATLIAIVLTFSRSAYISFILGLSILLFLKGKKLIAGALIIIFILLALITVHVSPETEGTNLLRLASGEARIDSMKNAITIFKDHPIFGIGFNSYRYAQRDYGFLDESRMIIHSGAGTDNSFLFVLATSGIVGFLAFLYLWSKILSIKNSLITASVLALFINSLFINSLFYPSLMLWMFTLIGILSSDGRFKENK